MDNKSGRELLPAHFWYLESQRLLGPFGSGRVLPTELGGCRADEATATTTGTGATTTFY